MAKPIKILDNSNQIISLLSEIGTASYSLIASEINTPRSSVYRLVDGLEAVGLVRIDRESGLVRLAERWLHLADATTNSFPEWQHLIDRLPRIVERTGYTTFLSIPTDTGGACIAWVPAPNLVVLALRPGRHFAFNIGAAGRLLFALSPKGTLEERLEHCEFETPTDQTIASAKELLADAKVTINRGWVFSDQDVNRGISAVGVAATSSTGSIGCLSLAGLSQDVNPQAEILAKILMNEASSSLKTPRL
ncbi:IclR family transcriptional regulator [Gulosibacter chungangensis]|uniref:Helix-turn-helix domain-containing protein n=1 Tax=Gulosibacter chungangensis TaxID=979746 RepID=A0A7J5B7L4_9MICO|nr:IclR family transcriptional regulator C-terminal domain-containing protein [Gulosibacter chungangensis]KAB1640991.1 helix-turn-helix domain-containing protein [Gulosibacter chungangensis]